MKKFKINANILALLMLVSIFAGWQYMILVMGFIWVFCDVTDQLKSLTVKVIAVYAGCLLFGMVWDIIANVWNLFGEGLLTILRFIGDYADVSSAIDAVNGYFLTPFGRIFTYAGLLVDFVIMVTKFVFIVSVVRNRPSKAFGFIQKYVNYFTTFANGSSYEEDGPKGNKKASHCPNCGAELPDGAAFCTSCGNRLD